LQIPFASYLQQYGTKYEALYYALRDAIERGELGCGMKLPSTRELASQYNLSRGTVNPVYETLAAEGYLASEVGRGTFVIAAERADKSKTDQAKGVGDKSLPLSPWGARVLEQFAEPVSGRSLRRHLRDRGKSASDSVSFWFPSEAAEGFPYEEWSRYLHAATRLGGAATEAAAARGGGLDATLGSAELRDALAAYLQRVRGIVADPAHIAVFGGSRKAIALLAQLVVGPGDAVVVESPGYSAFAKAAEAAGARALLSSIDESGLIPQPWDARLLFVTPNRQYPTGVTLPLERRQALLRWASERDAVIVEDDYDSEFRHRGRPLEPLKRLDADGRVAFIGSFSRTMPLDIRIGYAVLPPGLVGRFTAAMRMYEPFPAGLLQQRALAAFMRSGAYERHLRRMKRIYAKRYQLFRELAQTKLSHLFRWVESDAGLTLFGWWKHGVQEFQAYEARCRAAGVEWINISPYLLPVGTVGACFSFGHLEEDALRLGIARMEKAGELS